MLGVVLLTACQVEQLPADEDESDTTGYWDQAEVDAACENWATTQNTCAAGGPAVDELTDSCRDSVMVDNPSEDAGCYEALVDSYTCVGELSCDALAEYADAVGDYPCKAQADAVAQAC